MEFKERFKKFRIDNTLTQEQISSICCVSRSTVYKWEKGLALPNDESMKRLCNAFNVSEDELLGNIIIEQKNVKKNTLINKYINVSIILLILVIISFFTLLFFIPSIIRTISYQEDMISEVVCPNITINDNNKCRKVNPYKRYEGYSYSTLGSYLSEPILTDLKGFKKEESYKLNIEYDFDYLEIKYYYLDYNYNYLKNNAGYYDVVDQKNDDFSEVGFYLKNPSSTFSIPNNDYQNLIRIDVFKQLKDGLIKYRYYFLFE